MSKLVTFFREHFSPRSPFCDSIEANDLVIAIFSQWYLYEFLFLNFKKNTINGTIVVWSFLIALHIILFARFRSKSPRSSKHSHWIHNKPHNFMEPLEASMDFYFIFGCLLSRGIDFVFNSVCEWYEIYILQFFFSFFFFNTRRLHDQNKKKNLCTKQTHTVYVYVEYFVISTRYVLTNTKIKELDV
jgi:hypothetical protein